MLLMRRGERRDDAGTASYAASSSPSRNSASAPTSAVVISEQARAARSTRRPLQCALWNCRWLVDTTRSICLGPIERTTFRHCPIRVPERPADQHSRHPSLGRSRLSESHRAPELPRLAGSPNLRADPLRIARRLAARPAVHDGLRWRELQSNAAPASPHSLDEIAAVMGEGSEQKLMSDFLADIERIELINDEGELDVSTIGRTDGGLGYEITGRRNGGGNFVPHIVLKCAKCRSRLEFPAIGKTPPEHVAKHIRGKGWQFRLGSYSRRAARSAIRRKMRARRRQWQAHGDDPRSVGRDQARAGRAGPRRQRRQAASTDAQLSPAFCSLTGR